MKHACLIAGALCAAMTMPTQAKDLFELGLSVDSAPEVREGFTTISDLFDALSTEGLTQLSPGYTESSPATAALYVRGLPAEASFQSGSTTLRFRVPSLGIDVSFTGETRDDSRDQFEDYIKANGGDILKRMLKELARVSPVDPVAGNPGSLMAQMGAQDFADAASVSGNPGGTGSSGNLFGIGLGYDSNSLGPYDQNVMRLPLSFGFDLSNGYRLTLSAPIYRVESEGTDSYGASFGAALRIPLTADWALTPALRVGAAGSGDLGSAAALYSGSLTSRYVWHFAGGLDLGMTNQLALYQSRSISAGDYEADYDLSNRSLKNGLDLAGPLNGTFLGNGAQWRAWVIDTRFYGDELYSNSWQEYGVSVGTRVQAGAIVYEQMNLGVSYLNGENDVSGLKLNFGYRF